MKERVFLDEIHIVDIKGMVSDRLLRCRPDMQSLLFFLRQCHKIIYRHYNISMIGNVKFKEYELCRISISLCPTWIGFYRNMSLSGKMSQLNQAMRIDDIWQQVDALLWNVSRALTMDRELLLSSSAEGSPNQLEEARKCCLRSAGGQLAFILQQQTGGDLKHEKLDHVAGRFLKVVERVLGRELPDDSKQAILSRAHVRHRDTSGGWGQMLPAVPGV